MLTIGQMARCHALSTKTLRHYDRIGLFRPALTGQDNGYRYYAPAQIATLGRIVWLRQLGLGLGEIGRLARDGGLEDVNHWRNSLQLRAAALRACEKTPACCERLQAPAADVALRKKRGHLAH